MNLDEYRSAIAALETQQMALPRGAHIWPNPAIDAIANAADDLIASAPVEWRDKLVDMFTWGLAELD